MPADKHFINARLNDSTSRDILVRDGRIVAIEPAGERPAGIEIIDLGNALVVPGFVEGHIHLDTSFYGDTWRPHRPCTNGFNVHE